MKINRTKALANAAYQVYQGAYFLHCLFPGCFHLQLQALDLSWQWQVCREQQWMYFSVCKDVLPGRDPEIPSLGAE